MLGYIQRALLFLVGFSLPLQAFNLFSIGGFGMTPFKIATGLLFVLGALLLVFGRKRTPDPAVPWIGVYALTFGVSAIQGVLRGVPLQKQLVETSTIYLLLVYYLLIGFMVRTREDLQALLWGLMFGGVTTALPAVVGIQAAGVLGRFTGLSGQPNIFGFDMVVVVAVGLASLMATRGTTRRLVVMGVIFFAVVGVLLSLSRTAFVSGFAMWAFWVLRSRRIDTIRYIVPAALLLVGVLLLSPTQTRERFSDMLDPTRRARDGSIQSRFVQLELGAKAFASNPLFGIGVLHFPQWAQKTERRGGTHVIHNAYLRIAVAQGLFGLIPYLMILWISWRHYGQAYRMARQRRRLRDPWMTEIGGYAMFLQLAVLAMMVAGLAAHSQKSKTGWLMLGLAPAVARMSRERALELESGSGGTASAEASDPPLFAPHASYGTPLPRQGPDRV